VFHELSLKDSSFSKAGAKVLLFFDMTKFFGTFFSKKCFLTLFPDLLNPLFEGIAVTNRAVLHFHAVVTDGVRTVTHFRQRAAYVRGDVQLVCSSFL